MSRFKDLADINKILFDYCPEKTKYDLEQWVRLVLLRAYADVKPQNIELINFKYNETNIVFNAEFNAFNLLKVDSNNNILECSLLLSSFLEENYGLPTLKAIDEVLLLTGDDFDLMSIQLAQHINDWEENAVLLSEDESKLCHQTNTQILK